MPEAQHLRWNLRHLAYVAEAGKVGSIAAAAERLQVSQAAVSGAINNIEEMFGVRIFHRQPGRGLSLTLAGTTFLVQVETLLQQAKRLEESAALLSTRLSGTIRLGCFPTAVPHIVPSIMEGMKNKYPAISLELYEATIAELVELLKRGTIDVALTYNLSLDDSVTFERLFSVYQHVALSDHDDLAQRDVVSLRDLAQKPMILLDLPVCRERILDAYRNLNLKPKIHFQTASTTVVERLVASGQGYAMLGFRPQPNTYDATGRIKFLRLTEQLPQIDFGLALARNAKLSRALDAFLGLVRSRSPKWSFS
ncbi:LysR family transcriptional regulator [Chelatococcus asaccharovorans]|uniref:LysR family transcriptional regulator n=1 Tax=Chelatococcus asaccharovorans TaxID=28210 RepID=UPI00224C6A96|nr:LysR family transcriptional regulator [Chelatococcus asaccharovorans]CAH1668798.1 DNA-binding transcriptional LysR family regulator [Chelatococcus asaccharovorans]CAH1679752.1 DNA-binding transcriptional LysR family regulator [Chelatococcus asaccharovorans]